MIDEKLTQEQPLGYADTSLLVEQRWEQLEP